MQLRTIRATSFAHEFQMGPMRVKQPLPSRQIDQVSPFILLHHAGPSVHEAGKPRTRLSPHPHRGFEPVTFLFSGKVHHRDSMGNEGFLQGGDVQWMTAGKGIIHSEGPSEAFEKEGGTLELIQLWINLPRKHKMTDPRYQDIPAARIPVLQENGFTLRLVSGSFKDARGPAETFTPILAMMAEFEAGATLEVPIAQNFEALVYVLGGELEVNTQMITERNMVQFAKDGDTVLLKSKTAGRLLLLAGEPIDEPLVSYGPFVMNSEAEIMQAIADYEDGKMGNLDF